jgi:hypothetical protein
VYYKVHSFVRNQLPGCRPTANGLPTKFGHSPYGHPSRPKHHALLVATFRTLFACRTQTGVFELFTDMV